MQPPNVSGQPRAEERVIFALDDDAGDRLLLAGLVEQTGLEQPCRFFSSGGELMDELLKVLRGATAPLACFLDVKTAGMSGVDVLRWVRCQDALDSVPVIMLSSSDESQKSNEAGGVGAQCHIRKFPSVTELRDIITEAQRYSADRSTPAPFHLASKVRFSALNAPSRAALA